MQTSLLKNIDNYLGRLACSLFSPPIPNQIVKPATVLIIRPGGIGDAALLAPAVNLLKKTYPEICITILAERRNAGVFPLIPGVDEVLCYERPGELFRAVRGRYDVVIDTEQWHRLSALVARIVSAPVKVGFDTNERRRMFTCPVPYSHDDFEAVSFANLLDPLRVKVGHMEFAKPFLRVPDTIAGKADGLLSELGGRAFLTFFPGASIQERQWGADRFRRVAEMLSMLGIKIVVVGGKEDRQQGEVIVGGGLGLNLAGSTSLAETAAVIQKSSLLVSSDSGVLHIAVGLGTPTVSLFGPGSAKKWAPQWARHIVIKKGLDCSPCTTFGTTPPCPIDARCMRDITVDEVFNAVSMLLTSEGAIQSRCCKRDCIETA